MQLNLYFFLLIFTWACSFGQSSITNLEIAIETSKVTLWYPKAKVEKNELHRITVFVKRKNEDNFNQLIKISTEGKFTCVKLNSTLKATKDTIAVDSIEVDDWIYFENGVAYAGFVTREINWKQYEQIAKKMRCKTFQFRIVSKDFVTESKTPSSNGPIDTMALYSLRTRYEGGIDAFYKFLGSNIVYPEYARLRGLEGYTYLSFTLLPSGELEDLDIIKSIGGNTQESVINTYNKMPVWNRSNSNESIRFTLPVAFKLQ